MSARSKLILFVTLLVAASVAAWQLPLIEYLTALIRWIEANKQTAWIVFFATYVIATVLMVPGSILTLAAGYVFGLGYGFALVSVSSTVGATAAFIVGRALGRGWVKQKVGADARLKAIDAATRDRGFLVMLLLRLSPLFPFNVTNYAMSLTGISLRDYFFASWIGMIPGGLLYVYIGSAAGDLTALLAGNYEGGPLVRAFFVGGLIATLIATVLIARYANKSLRETIGQPAVSETP